MAQLQWRPIEAQQGSTRDIAVAGAAIGNSFDRMALMLKDREASLRKDATDQARVGYLRETDPEKMAAMIASMGQEGGLGRRVDMASVLAGAQAHRSGLIDTGLKNEQFLDIRDRVAQAPDVTTLYRVLADENATEEQRQAAYAGIADARDASGYAETGVGIHDKTRGRVETNRSNVQSEFLTGRGQDQQYEIGKAQVASSNARNAIEQQRVNRELEREAALERADSAGRSFIDGELSAGKDPQSALKAMYSSEAYKAAPSWARAQMRSSAQGYAGLERAIAPDERTAQGRLTSGYTRVMEKRIPQANKAQEDATRAAFPLMDIALKGEEYGSIPVSEVGQILNDKIYVGQISDANISNLLAKHPGLTTGHLKAIAERTGNRLTVDGFGNAVQKYLDGEKDPSDPTGAAFKTPRLRDYVANNGAGAARLQIDTANQGRVAALAQVRQLETLAKAADERGATVQAKELSDQARLIYMEHFDADGKKKMDLARKLNPR